MRGQTLIEYIIIIGIVITAVYAMGPAFRRGVQTVIRSTSDQLAVQKEAEQDFSHTSSHLQRSATQVNATSQRSTQEINYVMNTVFAESTAIKTNTVTNMGFSAQ